jgi:hypothetical protein
LSSNEQRPALAPGRSPADLGITCPACGGAEVKTAWQTFADGSRHVRATCAGCGKFLRYLPHGYKVERADPQRMKTHPACRPPPESWHWLGYVRPGDGKWRPVALAPTLEKAWDVLLHCPLQGDLLCCPVRPSSDGEAAPALEVA